MLDSLKIKVIIFHFGVLLQCKGPSFFKHKEKRYIKPYPILTNLNFIQNVTMLKLNHKKKIK